MTIQEALARFPGPYCIVQHPVEHVWVILTVGIRGYQYLQQPLADSIVTQAHADAWNADAGFQEHHVKAAMFGSIMGWDKPGADPEKHRVVHAL